MNLKKIAASVGTGGTNRSADVATVQFLLNCVPSTRGGPVQELKIDGKIGGLTIEAIRSFQRKRFNGFADGRVDPNGQTLMHLWSFDPTSGFSIPKVGQPASFDWYGALTDAVAWYNSLPPGTKSSVKQVASSYSDKQGNFGIKGGGVKG